MTSKYDFEKSIKKSDKFYIKDNDIYVTETNELVGSVDNVLERYRRMNGESFEVVYEFHPCLQTVLRCTECGTIIFSSDDVEDYEPGLRCPTCTDYKTGFKYWTGDEIKHDPYKRRVIRVYEDMERDKKERYEISRKRNGKGVDTICKWKRTNDKRYLCVSLKCRDIRKSYFKGLHIEIVRGKSEEEDGGYLMELPIRIPLSPSQFSMTFKLIRNKYMKSESGL